MFSNTILLTKTGGRPDQAHGPTPSTLRQLSSRSLPSLCLILKDQMEHSVLCQHYFFSLSLTLSCSQFNSLWKTELFSLLKMCFELNAQLHHSCYITCGLVLQPCPDSCVLLLSSALSIAVLCGFKHWFIWCPGSESLKLHNTLGMSSHYFYMFTLGHILLNNYIRTGLFISDITERR